MIWNHICRVDTPAITPWGKETDDPMATVVASNVRCLGWDNESSAQRQAYRQQLAWLIRCNIVNVVSETVSNKRATVRSIDFKRCRVLHDHLVISALYPVYWKRVIHSPTRWRKVYAIPAPHNPWQLQASDVMKLATSKSNYIRCGDPHGWAQSH